MIKQHICLLMMPDVAVSFKRESGKDWQTWVVKGEPEFRHYRKAGSVEAIVRDVCERLHFKDKLQSVEFSLVYAEESRPLLEGSIKCLHELECANWQIRRWDALYQQAAISSRSKVDNKIPSVEWMKNYVLPLLAYEPELETLRQQEHERAMAALQAEKQQLTRSIQAEQSTAKQSHEQTLALLQSEKNKLLQELQLLKQQHTVLAKPNMEQLLSFLPAIFKDFWNKVRPDELAIVAGHITVPVIPSPYFSPGQSAVLAKKRQFLQLAAADQQQIIRFCQELQHNYALQMHAEFSPLLSEQS